MNQKYYKYLGYLQIFIGMGALAGGLPMILTSDGSSSGLSTELLQNSPFENFLIPGLMLFSINGIGSLIASYFSLKFKNAAGILGVIFGSALTIWILTQFYFLGYASWIQPLYLLLGILEFILGLKVHKNN